MADSGLDSTTKPASKAAEQRLLRHRQELHHWQKNAALLRRRNLITGLAIGTFVVGMFGYTILSVKQERILEELDDEAKIHIIRGPRTGANS
ncbi:cytochrome c oxidase assembly factor 3 homolog, mitochondrial [Takifugu flavidus]|uniref:Cytochrome c oxidase assembly factor 3 n=1 Tax=Takifugu flavidus TaxID=433684 RepID=A0A5C6NV20_9TELE|nr:cytochrome c oxidase assembly factor 3 homolog, mitochondrial [Takifugu flavidus]TWW69467.1 Cytochrome c oxidase assembly factor 3 -like protein, mitochondrial [Takifugu flavidus]